ncbi:hypothetical protein ABTJ52_22120, partial [Acinetobacter baumannii]
MNIISARTGNARALTYRKKHSSRAAVLRRNTASAVRGNYCPSPNLSAISASRAVKHSCSSAPLVS